MKYVNIIERVKAGPLIIPAIEIPGFGKVFDSGVYRLEPRKDGGIDWYWFETEIEAKKSCPGQENK
jgi:hypothetical protein